MWSTHIASNMNFPAPLAVLGFVAALGGLFVALAAAVIFWLVRKPGIARAAVVLVAGGAAFYFALLLAFSAGSHETVLARGQEKYFCEIDCHLTYSVVDVQAQANGHFVITSAPASTKAAHPPAAPRIRP